jgi:hypothetical protein
VVFRLALIVVAVANAIFVVAFFGGFFATNPWLFYEDGPLENLQAVALVVAAFVTLGYGLREEREGRIIGVGLAAVFLACAVRELELRGLGLSDALAWFFHGVGQNVTIVAIFALYAICYARRWREIPSVVRALLQPRTIFYIAGVVILLLSSVAESLHQQVLEEWLEFDGYVVLLLAGVFLPYRDRPHMNRGVPAPQA